MKICSCGEPMTALSNIVFYCSSCHYIIARSFIDLPKFDIETSSDGLKTTISTDLNNVVNRVLKIVEEQTEGILLEAIIDNNLTIDDKDVVLSMGSGTFKLYHKDKLLVEIDRRPDLDFSDLNNVTANVKYRKGGEL